MCGIRWCHFILTSCYLWSAARFNTWANIIFAIYINDLCSCSTLLHFLLFADDTTIVYSSDDIDDLILTVNTELSLLLNWFNLNKLSLNPLKSSYMIFANSKNRTLAHSDIIIGNHKINKSYSCKFLRVEIDSSLKWLNHIRQTENKISSAIYIIRNIRHKINRSTALKLYDT